MGGRSSRTKGHNGERELATLLSEALGRDVYRNLEQARDGGPDLLGLPGLAVEVKRRETPSLETWWRQARAQARTLEVPVLAYRVNRKPWLFVVPLAALTRAPIETTLELCGTLTFNGFCCWYLMRGHDGEADRSVQAT